MSAKRKRISRQQRRIESVARQRADGARLREVLDRLSVDAAASSPVDDRRAALGALARCAKREAALAVSTRDAVASARAAGVSWHRIGVSLGRTGEAVRKRYAASLLEFELGDR